MDALQEWSIETRFWHDFVSDACFTVLLFYGRLPLKKHCLFRLTQSVFIIIIPTLRVEDRLDLST
jgi:hypothetical protein